MTSNRFFISHFRTHSSLGDLGVGDLIDPNSIRSAELRWNFPVFPVHSRVEERMLTLQCSEPGRLDRVTLLALGASSDARDAIGLDSADAKIGVSIGSSRGPTMGLESSHEEFLRRVATSGAPFTRGSASVPVHTSPTTTAGNISAALVQKILSSEGEGVQSRPTRSHLQVLSHGTSMTCSSAFHSLLAGIGFLEAGMLDRWVFGGAEAALTPYTLAQMEALTVYTRYSVDAPCRPSVLFAPGDEVLTKQQNSFTLGEGAGVALLSVGSDPPPECEFEVVGIGWGVECSPSATGITEDGSAFYTAMTGALSTVDVKTIDAVIAHAPGTIKGDRAEMTAIERVFGIEGPPVLSSKHLTGHTFGASGVLSLEIARQVALGATLPSLPLVAFNPQTNPRFLINSGGFGEIPSRF